ncbi:MAG: 1-aminocyclopropane-1-carboxylate deaminase [Maribacter sp.]|jgi:1-aminocyclopropane-1-carboxylate deaminase
MKKTISPIQEIKDEITIHAGVRLFIKREDLNHPTIQGNKYWKLLYNIEEAKRLDNKRLITFGGAFSNHIYATAAAGKAVNLQTIGIIRGERIEPLNYTLAKAEAYGMQLHFISRTDYRKKNESSFIEDLNIRFPNSYIIPEGGTNSLAIKGCETLAKEIQNQDKFDTVCLSVGTGGTIAGLVAGYHQEQKIIGFSSLKGNFLTKDVERLLLEYNGHQYTHFVINNDYHFGGYAKHKPSLISFINEFKQKHHIPLESIYTGKMMYGIYDLIQNGKFAPDSRILAIHTGGLQGLVGFNERYGNIII